ncbi:hypothetical protein N7492_009288 [Penicillium capsulatum]|uniref:Uncharacterized protein n=1 Tax=Penicillium capsulatum TaxID=69766 RepID=A0A9W9HUC7_9EURO|nr:hypothetical protein N7492_009288 [Penicillium capsulatum]KAJ6106682.1 hypothetical protein N7512_010199 [Penicillium capsulatum]
MERRESISSESRDDDDDLPDLVSLLSSKERPLPEKGILKPGRQADLEVYHLNIQHLKWIHKEENRLAIHDTTPSYSGFRARPSTAVSTSHHQVYIAPDHEDRPSTPQDKPTFLATSFPMSDVQKEDASYIWKEAYRFQQKRDKIYGSLLKPDRKSDRGSDHEADHGADRESDRESDLDLILQHAKETMTNISKDSHVVAMRIAALAFKLSFPSS